MLRSDEYGNVYDDGQPDSQGADPSQRYITTYTSDEFGNFFPQQVENPNYDIQRYDFDEYQRRVDHAATQRGGGGLAGFLSRGPLKRIGDAISEPVRQVSEEFYDAASKYALPAIGTALLGGVGSQFLPGLMGTVGGGATASSGIPSVANAATGAGEIGSFLTGAGAPGFTTSGALTPTFGGATFGAPTTLTGVMGGALPAAAAAGGLPSLSNIANMARTLTGGGASGGGIGSLTGRGGGYGGAQAPGIQNYNPSGNYANPYEEASPVATRLTGDYSAPIRSLDVGSDEEEPTPFAAGGGISALGRRGMQGIAPIEYKAGGKYLSGPGDGMSDNIKANIEGKQEARLADGEFVIPADVVSHLGNGSSNAGAKKLYAMMDKIRKARTGNRKQGKQINPDKFLPA